MRVLDLGDADADAVGRLLADLGADVLKIEPPGGHPDRSAAPSVGGVGIGFALHNANKRAATLDPASEQDRARWLELVADSDILIDSGAATGVAAFGTTGAELADRFSHLVVLSISDFGSTGPRAHWQATDPVLYAMSTALSRSGPTSGRPVLPPNGIGSATAAVQAAWAALVAHYHRLRCGTGDYIDFSRFEAVVQALDPPFGSEGQAAVGPETVQRTVARAPAKPADLSDVRLPRRLRPGLPALGQAVARDAGLARRAGTVLRPQVRDHRGPLRGVARTQLGLGRVVRSRDDGGARRGRATPRRAHRGGTHSGGSACLRTLPWRRRAHRLRTRTGSSADACRQARS